MFATRDSKHGADPTRQNEYRPLYEELSDAIVEAIDKDKTVGIGKRQ